MNKPDRRSFAFEFKLEVVARYVGGEATALELARDHGLRPRRKGRPPAAAAERSGPGELEWLRAENLRLSAKVACLENCGP
ncbi:transposase [Amycolatopsis sp. CFH S0740]|uniref:transposase n=1 Tax=Amycolatopsis sp. CFH S0740 TaxID=1644111 RepID=UPI001F113D56|nr:transposase [Amycolatopsis sp. CFH S0740]